MRNIADAIEQFIISELFANEQDRVDVKRSQLAEKLSCAPSQITYTLTTRFTPERGYEVESNGETGASSGSSACLGRQPSNPSCQRAKETCLPISWSRLWPPTN